MLAEWTEIDWALRRAEIQDEGDNGIELGDLATHKTALEVLSQPDPIVTKAYLANGSIVCLTTAVQAVVNSLLNNNAIKQGESANSLALLLDMVFANFSNKMVKGNWSEVDSVKKQSAVLLSYLAQAIACDMLTSRIPFSNNQPLIIGQASVVAALNALGYATAMASAAILNKRTYTKGEWPLQTNEENPYRNGRRAASALLVAVMAMGASAANRVLIDPASAVGIVLNMACSEVVNKIFKSGQGTEDKTANKIKLLACYFLSAVRADALIGFAIPSPFPRTNPWRYFSGTTVGATLSFVKVSAKALLDHDRVLIKGAPVEKKPPSKTRIVVAGLSSVAIPLATIALNHISYVNQSPTLSLAVKMVQHNANALAIGELFKLSTGTLQRVAISLVPAALAIGTELAANAIDPKNAGFSVLSVAAGLAASYCGMTLSGWLLGNVNSDDV